MLSTGEKTLFLFGSFYLFATSLCCANDILLSALSDTNDKYITLKRDDANKILFINGISILFSASIYRCFAYGTTK